MVFGVQSVGRSGEVSNDNFLAYSVSVLMKFTSNA